MSSASSTPTPVPERTIKVSVVSDLTCPWCYVGTKEIDRAIQKLDLPVDSPVKFELEHRPYLLHPTMPDDESHLKSEYLKAKLGSDKWEKVQAVLKARGEEVGIKFKSEGVVCSTWRGHRLLLLAWKKGGSDAQTKLLNAIYKAGFERGENVGDVDVLAAQAEETGLLSKKEAIEFLKSDDLKADVQRMVSCAQRNGVSGVPFTIIDGRWAISGGQTSEVFYKIFEKLAQGEEPES